MLRAVIALIPLMVVKEAIPLVNSLSMKKLHFMFK
nr:MAG TPA: hypothetical protein [Caudoviricetes sp.]